MSTQQPGFDYIGLAVVYFCHDGKGNFVMAKRSTNARDEFHTWDVGGGALDFGMRVEDTLKKEIKEEYCTDIISFEFLGYRDAHRVFQGRKTQWITLDFSVEVDAKKVKLGEPDKFTDLKWFTLDTIPQDIHSQLPRFFEKYDVQLRRITLSTI